jgi:glycosyltransferase involved in cell wall biosynthesis
MLKSNTYILNPYGTINSNSIASVINESVDIFPDNVTILSYNLSCNHSKKYINLFNTSSFSYRLIDKLYKFLPYSFKKFYLKNIFESTRLDFIYYLLQIKKIFKAKLKYGDIIILHAYPGILKFLSRYRSKAKIVFYYHNNDLNYFLSEGLKYFTQYSDGIIVLNEKPFNEILSYGFYNVWILNNYIESITFEKNNFVRLNFFFSGRLVKDKFIYELCSSFKKVYSGSNNCSLYLAGAFDDINYRDKVFTEIKSSKQIIFLGKLSKDEVHVYQSKAKYTILISKSEGSPLSLLEGAALDNTLIASDIPGCKEIIEAYGGYLVNNDNMVTNLVSIFKDLKEKNTLNYIIPKTVNQKNFTKASCSFRFISILEYMQSYNN